MKRVLGKKDCVESLTKTKMKVWLFLLKKSETFTVPNRKKGKERKKSKTFTVLNRKKGKESKSVSGKMD